MRLAKASFHWGNDVDGLWHRTLLAQDYALINPLQVDAALWSDLPVAVLVPPELEAQAHLMPRLLDLNAMQEEAKIQLLDRALLQQQHSRFSYFSAMLVSGLPMAQMASRLSKRLVAGGPDASKALLRFYDPRVFRHLCWVLSPDQLSRLLSGIESWTWCDMRGQWRQYRPADITARSDLRLAAGQWEDLQRLGLLNRCLQQIARAEPDSACDDAVAKSVNLLLKAAYERHGLADGPDRCLYAEQGVRFHPEIHRNVEIAERIARAGTGAVSYVDACRDLDDATLRRFAKDLSQSQGMSS